MCFRKFRKFRRKIVVLPIILIFTLNSLINVLCPSTIVLSDFKKCPVCYGNSVCDYVFDNEINIRPFNFHTTMSHIFSLKNVFFGEFRNKKIVVKKLAHYDEFVAFDNMICEEFLDCCKDEKYQSYDSPSTDYFSRIMDDVYSNFTDDDRSGLMLCPNSRNHPFLDKLKELVPRRMTYLNLWMLVRLNPEPLILEVKSIQNKLIRHRSEEGWPVPKYYGACGRMVIEEYVGLPLTAYYHSPWLLRAKIAVGLLEAVKILTFHDPEFSYYLTDMSPDNIAINNYDEPIFVDLENIIIVNKNNSLRDKVEDTKTLHKTEEIIDCKNCFVFSPSDICSHQISDHNYYAVCRHILSAESSTVTIPGGFLHSVPKDISSRYPDLKIMLAHCSVPPDHQTRIQIANKLGELLREIYSSESLI